MTYTLIGGIIFLLLVAVVAGDKKEEGFSARFGKASDFLSMFNKGFSLTGGLRATTREVAYKNALIIGQSGSGKTSTVLIGSVFNLARGNSSMAIMDVSGEIYQKTSGYLSKKGYKIYCIDFTSHSDAFNPLMINKSQEYILKVAQTLIANSKIESKSEPYWSSASEMIISTFLQYLVFYAEPQYCSLPNVQVLLETFAAEPHKIDKLFVSTNDEKLIKSYKAIVATPERTLQSVVSTALTALRLFKTPSVARCTAINTIDIASLRKEKTALYICIPLNQVAFLAPLSALLFETLFQEMLSRIPENKKGHSVFFLLDELITMKFQNLGLVYANCRKYLCGCIGLIQDERMLEMNYSSAEAHAIKTNSFSKVYLQGQPLATCVQLQEILGKYIEIDEKGIQRQKYLMEASAIRMSKESIILLGAELPLREKMYPYYSHPIFHRRTKIPAYRLEQKIPFTEPPLLNLDS